MNEKGKIIIVVTLMIAVFSLFTLHIIVLNVDSTVGEDLTSIMNKTEVLEEETIHLNQEIASASSITTIAKRAESLGLSPSKSIVSLVAPLPLAYVQPTL
jgi:cell division protein FtsL